MKSAILIGGIVPRPKTETARKRLLETIIPEWKKETEELNRVLEMATFGSPEGNLFLCLILKEFNDAESANLELQKNSVTVLKLDSPLVTQYVESSKLSQSQEEWEVIRDVAYQTYVQILDDQPMIVLIHDYPLRKV